MFWQPIVVIFLGCTLAGNTLTSAISFSRPMVRQQRADITNGDDLIQALKFLERYDEAQRNALNNMVDDTNPRYYDNEIVDPYGPPQYYDQGNDLPQPLFRTEDYPMPEMSHLNRYEQEFLLNGRQGEEPPERNSIGQQIEKRLEFEQLMDHLIRDAAIEELLRDDAQETAELMKEDLAAGESSTYVGDPEFDYYSSLAAEDSMPFVGDEDYDYSATSSSQVFGENVLDGNLTDNDDTSIEEFTSQGDLSKASDRSGIDKDLLETVIQQVTEETMKQNLLDEMTSNDMEDDDTLPLQFEFELDNFINKIMSELQDGSKDLANKLLDEIDDEKEELGREFNEEESEFDSSFQELDDDDESQDDLGVIFSNGWGSFDDEDVGLVESDESCPVLDNILEDCSVVDEFPGLGDEGYKQVFEIPCNRHQLCYICSGTYDIPKELCDDVYKMELMSICQQDPECEFRSKYFWLSAVASRTPFESFIPVCRESCVIELFISN